MADLSISDDRARRFATALQTFEKDGDAASFAALFADNATTRRFDARNEHRAEVAKFWEEYRGQFEKVSTTFTDVVEGGDRAALEWTSDGTLADGRPIKYSGVTVVDFAGDSIATLSTYYDSAQFTAVSATTGD